MQNLRKGQSAFVAALCLLLWAPPGCAWAQGLSPGTPAKEYIRLGGQVIAVENAQPVGSGTYSISGQVTYNGSGLGGAKVSLNGGESTLTGANGQYSFGGLAGAYYYVTAVIPGFQISPQSYNILVSPSNQAATANFTAAGQGSPGGASGPLQFVPLTPCRVVDTRSANGSFGSPSLAAASTRSFPFPSSSNCNIPSSASAYSVNVTLVPPGRVGYLTVWPQGQPMPAVATLNSYDGRTVANQAILPAGSNGGVSVYSTDATDLLMDINGYFTAQVSPGQPNLYNFFTVSQCNAVNTQNANGPLGGPSIGAGAVRSFSLSSGVCSIPSTASAYSLNVTAIPPASLPWMTVWPEGQSQPRASTLNSYNGQEISNSALVPAGSGGVSVFAEAQSDVQLDVNGYFLPANASTTATPLVLVTIPPCRVTDTRMAAGPFGGPGLANSSRTFPLPSSNACTIPVNAKAFSMNVTVVPQGSQLRGLTVWAADQTQPSVTTLHAFNGQIVNNAVIVAAAANGGGVSVYATDATDVILDINGYFVSDTQSQTRKKPRF